MRTTEAGAAELELRSHFVGKRDGVRVSRRIPVHVEGSRESCYGRVVDISRSGVLLELHFREAHSIRSAEDLVRLAEWLQTRFAQGITVNFLSGTLRAPVRLARLAAVQEEAAAGVRIGCAFVARLSRVECALLGLSDSDDRHADADATA